MKRLMHKIPYKVPRSEINFVLWEQFRIQDFILVDEPQAQVVINTILSNAFDFSENELGACYRESDTNEPYLDQLGKVNVSPSFPKVMQSYQKLWQSWQDGGDQRAVQDFEIPVLVQQACIEAMMAGNASFMTYVGFIDPAITLLETHAADDLKEAYLPALRDASATACLCITELDAGSDLTQIKTEGLKGHDGIYRMSGHKWLISGGSHELTDNIYYFVLARSNLDQKGMMGLSCFLVPRFRLDSNGKPSIDNGVRVGQVVAKMGLKGCANTLLTFGEGAETQAYLLGEKEGTGIIQLLSMMKSARLSTALFALGLASRAQQTAESYAKVRIQGKRFDQSLSAKADSLPISQHGDIRRMWLEMNAYTTGCRSLIARIAYCQLLEKSEKLSEKEKNDATKIANLLLPIVKSYTSDKSWRVSELAIQTLGGVGYTTDYSPQQTARDCKVLSIWEGTNSIQSLFLLRDTLGMCLQQKNIAPIKILMEQTLTLAKVSNIRISAQIIGNLPKAWQSFEQLFETIGDTVRKGGMNIIPDVSVELQDALGDIFIAIHLLEAANIASTSLSECAKDSELFYRSKIDTAEHFLGRMLPKATATLDALCNHVLLRKQKQNKHSELTSSKGNIQSFMACLMIAGMVLLSFGDSAYADSETTEVKINTPIDYEETVASPWEFGFQVYGQTTDSQDLVKRLGTDRVNQSDMAVIFAYDKAFSDLSFKFLTTVGIAEDRQPFVYLNDVKFIWNISPGVDLSLGKNIYQHSFFELIHLLDPVQTTDFLVSDRDRFTDDYSYWNVTAQFQIGGTELGLSVFDDITGSYEDSGHDAGFNLNTKSFFNTLGLAFELTKSNKQNYKIGSGIDIDLGRALLVFEADVALQRNLREVITIGRARQFAQAEDGYFPRFLIGSRFSITRIGQFNIMYLYNSHGYNSTEWATYRVGLNDTVNEIIFGNFGSQAFLSSALNIAPNQFLRQNYLAISYTSADLFSKYSVHLGSYLNLDDQSLKGYAALDYYISQSLTLDLIASSGGGSSQSEFRQNPITFSILLRKIL